MEPHTDTPTIREHLISFLERNILQVLIGLCMWGLFFYYAITFDITRGLYGVLFLGAAVTVYALNELTDALTEKDWLNVVLLLASAGIYIVATTYFTVNFETLNRLRIGYALEHEYQLAIALLLATAYLTLRSFSIAFFIVFVASFVYALYGNIFPGILAHPGIDFQRLLRGLVINFEGVYGYLVRLVGTWIAPFFLYSALMQGYGAFDYILTLAVKSSKYIKSGVLQSAMITSALIGMINGSSTANAGITGSITIPTMNTYGVQREDSAAIEAVASTTGQVLPPVMGAAAFLIAALLGVRYIDVIVATILPTTILIVTLVVGLHIWFLTMDVETESDTDEFLNQELGSERVDLWSFEAIIKYGVPFVGLVYLLGVAQVAIVYAGMLTCILMLATGTILPVITGVLSQERSVLDSVKNAVSETYDGIVLSIEMTAPIMILVAAINVVVDIFTVTGLPNKLSLFIIDMSGGIMLLAIILAVIIAILLGMGMPTSAAYLISALVIIPGLISNFGIPPMAAHFLGFYAAIVAAITPPIAPGVAVANGISGGGFMKSCFKAVKFGSVLFVLPLVFAYNPEIIVDPVRLSSIGTAGIVLLASLALLYTLFRYSRTSTRVVSSTSSLVLTLSRAAIALLAIATMVMPTLYLQAGMVVVLGIALVSLDRFVQASQSLDTGQFSLIDIVSSGRGN